MDNKRCLALPKVSKLQIKMVSFISHPIKRGLKDHYPFW